MDFAGLSLIKVKDGTSIKQFDCGDDDLNSFLISKSIPFSKELLATTYILEDEKQTVAFFSIFNDSIRVEESLFPSTTAFKKFKALITPHGKRHLKNFPAIKIGRLAVNKHVQKGGVGKGIISFILDLALNQNQHCACKFISVDAYDKSLGFYEKIGFVYLSENDLGKDTRQMFLDLTPYLNSIQPYSE